MKYSAFHRPREITKKKTGKHQLIDQACGGHYKTDSGISSYVDHLPMTCSSMRSAVPRFQAKVSPNKPESQVEKKGKSDIYSDLNEKQSTVHGSENDVSYTKREIPRFPPTNQAVTNPTIGPGTYRDNQFTIEHMVQKSPIKFSNLQLKRQEADSYKRICSLKKEFCHQPPKPECSDETKTEERSPRKDMHSARTNHSNEGRPTTTGGFTFPKVQRFPDTGRPGEDLGTTYASLAEDSKAWNASKCHIERELDRASGAFCAQSCAPDRVYDLEQGAKASLSTVLSVGPRKYTTSFESTEVRQSFSQKRYLQGQFIVKWL